MFENAPLPRSKATNAYDLLDEIKQLILEEPRNYDQTLWMRYFRNDSRQAPPCGTVACVAGWTCALKGFNRISQATSERAADILGLDIMTARALFSGGALYYLHCEMAGCPSKPCGGAESCVAGDMPKAGTMEYAQLGVEHISRFQRKYEAQLRAKSV